MGSKLTCIILTLILMVLFLVHIVSAQVEDFIVSYKSVKETVTRDEVAEYTIIITNYKDYDDRFRFNFVFDPKWSYQTKPNYLGGIDVAANSERTVSLYVYPNKVSTGQSVIRINIESENTGKDVNLFPVVNVITPQDVKEYEEDIKTTVTFSNEGKLDPREEATIKIELKNKNLLNIKDLSVKIQSKLINAEKSGIDFKPLERKFIEFQVNFDPKEKPQKDTLIITLSTHGKTFSPLKEEYEIAGYESSYVIETLRKTPFPFTTEYLKVTNPGTLTKTETISIEASPLKRFLTSSNADDIVVSKDGTLNFVIKLDSEQSKQMYIRTHYWIVVLAIIIAGVIVYSYYKLRTPICLHKKAFVSATKEGGISEIKVLINVHNRGKANVDNLIVSDSIPNIADLHKEFESGTLKPFKVFKHKTKGTIIKWDLSSLEKYEERIVTYKIKSKLSILGGMTLPTAAALFRYLKKERRSFSKEALIKL